MNSDLSMPTCQLCGGELEDLWNSGMAACPCGGTALNKKQIERWQQERRDLIADLQNPFDSAGITEST